jgi:hypothetical protein
MSEKSDRNVLADIALGLVVLQLLLLAIAASFVMGGPGLDRPSTGVGAMRLAFDAVSYIAPLGLIVGFIALIVRFLGQQKGRRAFASVIANSGLMAMASIAPSAAATEGYVLEYKTRKPVANAIVMARWDRRGIHGSWCAHMETAITDEQGKYRIRGYSDELPLLQVYARGYQPSTSGEPTDDGHLYIEPLVGSGERRATIDLGS